MGRVVLNRSPLVESKSLKFGQFLIGNEQRGQLLLPRQEGKKQPSSYWFHKLLRSFPLWPPHSILHKVSFIHFHRRV